MKRLLSLVISLAILGIIYARIQVTRMVPVFEQCDVFWLVISLAMVVPLNLVTAWRLDQLMPAGTRLGIRETNQLILAASVLNLVLPSKMGDVAKAWFMKERGHLRASQALALVVYEKACDMLSLLLWCAFGLMLYPHKDGLFWLMTLAVTGGLVMGLGMLGWPTFAEFAFQCAGRVTPAKVAAKLERVHSAWREMQSCFGERPQRLALVAATSVGIWLLHLLQIWMFVLALRGQVPFLASLALAPLAILAGLLPLTLAGIGTRDAALILFYQPFLSAPVAAALGVLCTLRYVLPALVGVTVVNQYLPGLRSARAGEEPAEPAPKS